MDMRALLGKMLIFITLMVLGYLAARTGKVSPAFAKGASWLTINVFMTGTIINSAITNVPDLTGKETANVIFVLFVTLIIMYLLATLAGRVLKQDRQYEGLSVALMAVVNNMFIGLPVVQQIAPGAALYVSLSCLPYNLLLYTYGVWRMKAGAGKFAFTAKELFSVPLIATLAAFVIFLFKIPVPPLGRELMTDLANATMPLSMLVVGTSLGSIRLGDAFRGWQTYAIAFVRLLLCPVLVWLVIHRLTDNALLITAATIVAASPSGIVVTALALNYDKDAVYTSKCILVNTAISMATIPLIVFLLL